jgi:hypothetical protein
MSGAETARSGTAGHPCDGAPRPTPAPVPDGQGGVSSGEVSVPPDASPLPVLISLQFLRAALRRRRILLFLGALLGLLAGAAFPLVVEAGGSATATLFLSHDPSAEPARAMSTDISLLTTRTVAERALKEAALPGTPEDLLASVTYESTTSDLLVLTMRGPTGVEAARRLDVLAEAYLDFRGTQVSAHSDAVIRGTGERIAALREQLDEQSALVASLSGGRDDGAGRLNEAISRRAQLTSQISALQETVQAETLSKSAILSASRVIDPAVPSPPRGMVRRGLYLVSGMIAGTAAVFACVVLLAIISDRIRLRSEVATALKAPVRASTGALAPPSLPRRAVGAGRAWRRRGLASLRTVAPAVQRELVADPEDRRLAVVSVDSPVEVCLVVATAALTLRDRAGAVHVVDLTVGGGLGAAMATVARHTGAEPLPVTRPGAVPSIASAPPPLAAPPERDRPPSLGPRDLLLIAADLDEGIGAEHLGDWCSRALVAVTSGRSGAERVRTAGEVLRAAGLQLRGALLLGAEPADHSCGVRPEPPPELAAGEPAERVAG